MRSVEAEKCEHLLDKLTHNLDFGLNSVEMDLIRCSSTRTHRGDRHGGWQTKFCASHTWKTCLPKPSSFFFLTFRAVPSGKPVEEANAGGWVDANRWQTEMLMSELRQCESNFFWSSNCLISFGGDWMNFLAAQIERGVEKCAFDEFSSFLFTPRNFCRNSMGKKFNQCLPSIIGANGMAEKIRKCNLLPNRIVSVAFNGHLLKIIYLRLLHRNLQEKWKFWASTTTQRRFRCCWLQLQASFSSRSPIFWTSMWWARKPQM